MVADARHTRPVAEDLVFAAGRRPALPALTGLSRATQPTALTAMAGVGLGVDATRAAGDASVAATGTVEASEIPLAGLTAPAAMVIVARESGAVRAAAYVTRIGTATAPIQTGQLTLTDLATPPAVGFIAVGIDAEVTTADLAGRARDRTGIWTRTRVSADAGSAGARLAIGALVAASTAVQGIRAGIHANLAALEGSTLALLFSFLLLDADRGMPLLLLGIGVVPGALALPFPVLSLFRVRVEAGEPDESEDQAAERRAPGGPVAGQGVKSRSVHARLQLFE